MPALSSVPTRKRSRAQLIQEDEDLDELSPQKVKNSTPISASSKKIKLQTYGSSPANKVGWVGSIKEGLSGLLGSARGGKRNHKGTEDADELGREKDIWEVDSTDDEGSRAQRKASRAATIVKGNATTAQEVMLPVAQTPPALKKRKSARDSLRIDMVGHDQGKEEGVRVNGHQQRKGRGDGEEQQSLPKATTKTTSQSVKRPVGRPSKSALLQRAKAQARDEKRKELSAADQGSDEGEGLKKSRKRRTTQTEEESIPPFDSEQAIPSIVDIPSKATRELQKLAIDMVESQTPKGILTPTRKKGIRPSKSVTFEKHGKDMDLGFKDLPTSASAKKPRAATIKPSKVTAITTSTLKPAPPVEEEDDESDQEEEASCSICSELHSRKGNQILFCDGCDLTIHQKCYNVPQIPKGDWYCRVCRPELASPADVESSEIPEIEGFENHLRNIQRIVLDRLTGQRRIKLSGHDDQLQKVQQVVEQTVLAGEGNSMLVIGGRGCGKTTLVESVIADISRDHRDKFHVVRLNGFIHTDDKLASREIWRQLGLEMEVEDDSIKASNHADTLAALLALLSHPSELTETSSDQTSNSVIFVLDEFDLFTTHARQTLLYNLFDIAQARKAPIAVLGLTTRIDVVENLEKRVKSRFSHRYVYLSSARSPPNFWEICREGLTIRKDIVDEGGLDLLVPGQDDFISCWNTMIDNLWTKNDVFKSHVQAHFYRTKSVPAFLTSCIMPIATLSTKNFPLTGNAFASSILSLAPSDSKLQILQGLSELELSLLIAAARLDIILDTDTCNFAMAYDEYSSLTSRHKIQTSSTGMTAMGSGAKVWGREIALDAWERLGEYEVLVPTGIGNSKGQDAGAGGRMWKVDVGLEEIAGSVDGMSGVMSKWCREI